MSEKPSKNIGGADQFALIAATKPTDRMAGLVVPQAPVLPDILLPVQPADGREFFTPLSARDTPEAVRADLDALKKNIMADFLGWLAFCIALQACIVKFSDMSKMCASTMNAHAMIS